MIYDEDPLRRRPRESTARRLRHERCVWMARETTKWPSTRWPITKIMSSDGCNGNRVPLEMGPWYDFREFGCHLGNVGLVVDVVIGQQCGRRHNKGTSCGGEGYCLVESSASNSVGACRSPISRSVPYASASAASNIIASRSVEHKRQGCAYFAFSFLHAMKPDAPLPLARRSV